jgi:proteasome lid subunit RPN8/RPN11
LSHDEIVFGDVRYREPARALRPDLDRRWACVAYEVPTPADMPIFLDLAAADAIERHALRDTTVELGGILLGKECVDEQTGLPFVWVTRSLEAKHYENTQASFTYTHESWEEITRERDRRHPDLDIVGWYHTHPDFGIFLSHHDMFIQRHFFGQPLQVAYVVDPIRQTRGFFRWHHGEMEPTGGFYLTSERGDRVALARMANDLENLPNAEPSGGVGGLSPRLEAELLAMLSRPATHAHMPAVVDRTQALMVFTLLGFMLGMIMLAAVLWLNALNSHVADQAVELAALRKAQADHSERVNVALDAALGDAAGNSPERFLAGYARAARERDEAKQKLANQLENSDLLLSRARLLGEQLAEVKAKYETAKKFEKDAKEVADLRLKNAELLEKLDGKTRTVSDLQDMLDTPKGREGSALFVRYQRTWYVAAAACALSAILALALVGGYLYVRGVPGGGLYPTTDDPEPHRIT